MYLVVDLCTLGTTSCINFEHSCKFIVTVQKWLPLPIEEEENVDFAWACLNKAHFTDHLLFKTGFVAPRVDLKKQFLL